MQALVEGLRARRLDQRTSIVVVGDHGEAFGEHLGNIGHSLFVYEENVHVPWMIVVPGLTDSTIRIPNITSLVDVPSTILDLVGLTRSDADEGHGLGGEADDMALYFTDYSLSWVGLSDGAGPISTKSRRGDRSSSMSVKTLGNSAIGAAPTPHASPCIAARGGGDPGFAVTSA